MSQDFGDICGALADPRSTVWAQQGAHLAEQGAASCGVDDSEKGKQLAHFVACPCEVDGSLDGACEGFGEGEAVEDAVP